MSIVLTGVIPTAFLRQFNGRCRQAARMVLRNNGAAMVGTVTAAGPGRPVEQRLASTVPGDSAHQTFVEEVDSPCALAFTRAAKPAESTAGRRHGGPHETRIAPTLARYVRVQALKPDGPNQPGMHMNIEELQVFAAR